MKEFNNMRDEFPEVFAPLSGWHLVSHNTMDDAVVFIQSPDIKLTFGINHLGEWTYNYGNKNLHGLYNKDVIRQAEEHEVRALLIREAISRGLWDVPIVSTSGFKTTKPTFEEVFDKDANTLWSEYGRVFSRGEWATVAGLTLEQRVERLERMMSVINK